MNSAVLGIEFCAMHDAIEPGHGPPRMKTFAAVREMEMMCKVAQTASLSAPLVQIAHQDGGHAFLLPCVCDDGRRSEEHTSELQSLMRISYAVFCLNKKKQAHTI